MKAVSQGILRHLADRWAPDFTQVRRMSTCACCGRKVIRPYHCWLSDGKFLKELHLCRGCWAYYAE